MNKARCPICDTAMPGPMKDWPDYPFCSPRCRLIDLGRWLGEQYRVPDEAGDETIPNSVEREEKDP